MEEEIEAAMTEHQAEFHRFDEDVRQALFGPLIPGPGAFGERNRKLGLVEQVKEMHSGGMKTSLGGKDRALIAFLIILVEVLQIVRG